MLGSDWLESDVSWLLVYTKPHAEVWAEANLRNQGFMPLLPRVVSRGGFAPLFRRYLFVGFRALEPPFAMRSTLGVLYVVSCGDRPARVPSEVIADLTSRMDENGVVRLEPRVPMNPLFAKREQQRRETLIKLAAAGFRVKAA